MIEFILWTNLAIATVSAAVFVGFVFVVRRMEHLEADATDGPKGVSLSVVIPARNEEDSIAACVRSICRQGEFIKEIIIVNDHSTDQTGEIISSLAASEPRVKIIENPTLKNGWLGKANAMQIGADKTQGDYILFSDADITHADRCIATGLKEMQSRKLDMISLLPRLDCVSITENAILSNFVGFMVLVMIQSWLQKKPVAAGAFILIKKAALKKVGGFESIRTRMLDDVEFARHVRRQGYNVGYVAAPSLLRVRLFKGNKQAFWGPTKNILSLVEDRPLTAIPMMIAPLVVFWMPLLSILIGSMKGEGLLMAVGFGIYMGQYLAHFPGRRIWKFDSLKLCAFPLVAISNICCCSKALHYYLFKGSVVWRDRVVRIRN